MIPNGIDVARYDAVAAIAPRELGLPDGRSWITYLGRLDRQKGLSWLVEQSASWLAAHSGHDILLVGDGPERQALATQIARIAPPGRLHLTGWQSNVPGILAASDLVVLPSRWEGMPNAVLEAMASGRPVLAADVEGVRELLGEDADHQIARPEDAGQWREKLGQLLADRQLAAELGTRNRARARERFSIATVVRSYAELYQSLARA